jgi:GNAT superfamily N-acetyltransferase
VTELYREPPRSYWSLLYVIAFFAVGFAIDAALGGAGVHLIGWLIAIAVVGGAWALVIYALRSEKSLVVTAEEVRIGDEAFARDRLVAISTVDDDELPVLGWPRGKPRQLRSLAVRTADGSDLIIPTRDPERLGAVLGLTEPTPSSEHEIRVATVEDLPLLAEIDERAEALFRAAGYRLPEWPLPEEKVAEGKAVFVAGRPPVGFVWIDEVDGLAHVQELAVIPKWMRRGIGTRLLEQAADWAREQGYPAITLLTFGEVPWNGPFYRARGYVEIDELTPGLVALREEERALGLDDLGRRVVMRRDL